MQLFFFYGFLFQICEKFITICACFLTTKLIFLIILLLYLIVVFADSTSVPLENVSEIDAGSSQVMVIATDVNGKKYSDTFAITRRQ